MSVLVPYVREKHLWYISTVKVSTYGMFFLVKVIGFISTLPQGYTFV